MAMMSRMMTISVTAKNTFHPLIGYLPAMRPVDPFTRTWNVLDPNT